MSATARLMDVPNLVGGHDRPPSSGSWLDKLQPADGALLCRVARSGAADVDAAVAAAVEAQPAWAAVTPVERGRLVRELAIALQERREGGAARVVPGAGQALPPARGAVGAAPA